MKRVYATRSLTFKEVEHDYNNRELPFDQRYIARIFRACERNKVYFIGLKESRRTIESLRMLISKTASEMGISVRTSLVDGNLAFFIVGDIDELII